ncbi:MAG: hypothetical protein K2X94_03320 [Amoebophilaceae bacterium]|nr:hypothetical protein [Amoebophilaceae bacterium]
MGIAFSGKAAIAAYSVYDLFNKQAGMVRLTNRYSKFEQKSEKQGIKVSEERGIEKGSQEEKRSIAKYMLKKGLDVNLIVEVTGLSKRIINALYKDI